MAKTNSQKKIGKSDGLQNIFTGLAIEGKDKRTGRQYNHKFLNQIEVEKFYQGSDTAAKIIDRLPQEMTREGITVSCPDFPDLNDAVQEWFEQMGINCKVEQGLKWGPLYGGAGGILGLEDGLDPSKPVDLGKIQAINYFTVMHRYDFAPPTSQQIEVNPSEMNFRKPRFYKIAPIMNGSTVPSEAFGRIHHSRLIRFEGVAVNGIDAARVNYWGDSILSRLWNAVTNYESAHDSAAIIMEDVVKLIFKIKGLTEMIAMGDEDLVKARLRMINRNSSVVNGFIIEEGEDAESKTTNLAGIPDLLRLINARLVAATDMPHTIILGNGPDGGIGATGKSEKDDWYDHVKNRQESILRPIYKRLITLFLSSKTGPTKGKVPSFTITFNPLSQPTEKEMVATRKIQMEIDTGYIEHSVYDAEEVAESRFGGTEYSYETTLNEGLRKAIDAPTPQDPDEPQPIEAVDPQQPVESGKKKTGQAKGVQVTSQEIALNGAQVSSLLEVITAVTEGKMPRESAVALIRIAFALTDEDAERIMGSVGKGFKPTPSPQEKAPIPFEVP